MEKIEFKNYEDSPTTPINAQALNAIQDNIEQAIADVEVDVDFTELENAIDKKADKSDTYTKTEVDVDFTELENAIDNKADKSNTYTKTEVDLKLKENYMFLKLGSQLRTYTTTGDITGLVLEEQVGNSWTLDSSGLKVRFNETTKIEISANFFYRHFGAYQGEKAIDVYMVKNSEDVGRSSFAAPAVNTFCPFIFSPLKLDVNTGDSIYFKWVGTGTDGYFHHGTNSTYIMIKKVR